MPQRLKYFLVVLLLMFAKENFSQNGELILKCDTSYYLKYDCVLRIPYKRNATEVEKKRQDNYADSLENVKVMVLKCDTVRPIFRCILPDPASLTNNELRNIKQTRLDSLVYGQKLINNYTKTLGGVCRIEYQFQKTTSIPLRLRLGSLEYTNYLEQKPNALKPPY
jgi:hypothetical protein